MTREISTGLQSSQSGKQFSFIFLFALLWSFGHLNAQSLYLGVKGGYSLPELSGGTNEISKGWMSRSAFNFGLSGYDEISRNLALQVELNFASQGGKKDGLQPIPDGAIPGFPSGIAFYADFKNVAILNYLEIPIVLKYTLLRTKSHKLYFDVGPYFGYLLNAKNKTSGSSYLYLDKNGTMLMIPDPENPGQYIPLPSQNLGASTDIKSDINSFNAGINGGIGVSQTLGNGDLFLDVKGYYGFLNIQKNSVNGKNNTGALVVSLGYAVKIN
jgi:hypothetical protein